MSHRACPKARPAAAAHLRAGETPSRIRDDDTDRPARRRVSAGSAGPKPTSHQARQRKMDEAESAHPTPSQDEVQPGFGRFPRIKVGFPSSVRPRIPVAVEVRPKPRPALFGVHSRISGCTEPKPGSSTPLAPPKRHRGRGRAKSPLIFREGKPSTAPETTKSARRPGSRAMSTKAAPFQGRRDPACRLALH